MTGNHSRVRPEALSLLMVTVGTVAALAAIGYVPTTRLGGPEAVPAMLAGCAVSTLASLFGAVPTLLALRKPAKFLPQSILLSTALRFLVVLLLTLATALSGWFDAAPLLVWIAISYVVLLLVDSVYALRLSSIIRDSENS